MTYAELLEDAVDRLRHAGVENCSVDARFLLQFVTGLTGSQLILAGKESVDLDLEQRFNRTVVQRCQRIPLHYIIGTREFWSMDFAVSPAVLIPRPETEFLLEHVLATYRSKAETEGLDEAKGAGENGIRILDMCTGSGVIAVVLAKELQASVTGVDVSVDALAIAHENVLRHHMGCKVQLVCGNLFSPLSAQVEYDIIVSNPPYIAEAEIDLLEPEVSRHEPRLALAGGEFGLRIIQQLAIGAESYLKSYGWLFIEIGADQEDAVIKLFASKEHNYIQVKVLKDWAGRPRVLQAQFAG